MPELPRADEGVRDHARPVRQYRRQAVFAVTLAFTIFLHQYVTLGGVEPWLDRLQLTFAGVLIIDVLVRPVLRRIVPTEVIVNFGERKE